MWASAERSARQRLAYAPWLCLLCPSRFFTLQEALLHFSPEFGRHPESPEPQFTEIIDADKERRVLEELRTSVTADVAGTVVQDGRGEPPSTRTCTTPFDECEPGDTSRPSTTPDADRPPTLGQEELNEDDSFDLPEPVEGDAGEQWAAKEEKVEPLEKRMKLEEAYETLVFRVEEMSDEEMGLETTQYMEVPAVSSHSHEPLRCQICHSMVERSLSDEHICSLHLRDAVFACRRHRCKYRWSAWNGLLQHCKRSHDATGVPRLGTDFAVCGDRGHERIGEARRRCFPSLAEGRGAVVEYGDGELKRENRRILCQGCKVFVGQGPRHVSRSHLKLVLFQCRLCDFRSPIWGGWVMKTHGRDAHGVDDFRAFSDHRGQCLPEMKRLMKELLGIGLSKLSFVEGTESTSTPVQFDAPLPVRVELKQPPVLSTSQLHFAPKTDPSIPSCRLCDKPVKLRDKSKAKNHIAQWHLKDSVYSCSVCAHGNNRWGDAGKMRSHVLNAHKGTPGATFTDHRKELAGKVAVLLQECFGFK